LNWVVSWDIEPLGKSVIAVVALGSNLGDRQAHLEFAFARLASILEHLRCSSLYDTEPVDVPDAQPRFLNAAAAGETALPPRELLDVLLSIERERGRERPRPGAARTLDLDLILYGDLTIAEPALTVPHPRFRERRFVLEPVAEIVPEAIDPGTGRTMSQLLGRLEPRDHATPRR
jgi:2-amino-4-hydroxy-6-hydroxymethyldihydropteridine diphosphokinase